MNSPTITFRLPRALLEKLKAEAERLGVSLSVLIRLKLEDKKIAQSE